MIPSDRSLINEPPYAKINKTLTTKKVNKKSNPALNVLISLYCSMRNPIMKGTIIYSMYSSFIINTFVQLHFLKHLKLVPPVSKQHFQLNHHLLHPVHQYRQLQRQR
jgi:hypothetical protein